MKFKWCCFVCYISFSAIVLGDKARVPEWADRGKHELKTLIGEGVRVCEDYKKSFESVTFKDFPTCAARIIDGKFNIKVPKIKEMALADAVKLINYIGAYIYQYEWTTGYPDI